MTNYDFPAPSDADWKMLDRFAAYDAATHVFEMDSELSRAKMAELIGDRLGITREQFLERLDAGEYAGCQDGELLHLVTLAPFAREVPHD